MKKNSLILRAIYLKSLGLSTTCNMLFATLKHKTIIDVQKLSIKFILFHLFIFNKL